MKLLAKGKESLKTPVNILVSRASTEAIKAVEEAGGSIVTRYYTKYAIRRILRGESDSSAVPLSMDQQKEGSPVLSSVMEPGSPFKYRLPDPSSRADLEYYRDVAHRGYLSHLVEEGHGPSLFFKTPGTRTARKVKKAGKSSTQVDEVGRLF